jgi:transposase
MQHTRFIGLDIHKERISIAVAESDRSGPVEYLGEIANEPGAIGKLCDRLGRAAGKRLAFCYEAGPCGYGVHRQLTSLGHRCDVVAPSLIPRKPGDRVKTNRRDATMLARLHRAGEPTPIWTPDADHEAMRDLSRPNPAQRSGRYLAMFRWMLRIKSSGCPSRRSDLRCTEKLGYGIS